MTKQILLIIFSIVLMNCGNKAASIKREGEPPIYSVHENDKEMNEAIKVANQTIGIFKKALARDNPDYYSFSIKMRFDTPNGGEHIWISDIYLKDNEYYGTIGNIPEFVKELKLGDTIKIDNNKISDWMYIDNQKLCGGYSVRFLRNRMPESERKQFDEECGFIIE